MLEKLLALLKDPRPHSLADLAHELDTTPEMVTAMLEALERMGYVRQVAGCSPGGTACTSCPMKHSCTPAGPTRIWTLVE